MNIQSKETYRIKISPRLFSLLVLSALVLSACQKATTIPTGIQQPSPTSVPALTATTKPTSADNVTINIKGGAFSPKRLTINVGTAVTWIQEDSRYHTVTADDGSFDSGGLSDGETFSFTFTKPGVYAYYCSYHGGPGGQGMSGVVEVTQ